MRVSGHFGALKRIGGKQDIPATKPIWNLSGTTTIPQMVAFDTLLFTATISHNLNGPISAIQNSGKPAWMNVAINATDAGCAVTLTGTPDNLSYLGTYPFTLTAINKFGTTSHNFTITIIDGTLPAWGTNTITDGLTSNQYHATANVSVPGTPHPGPLTNVAITSGTIPTWMTLSWNSSGLVKLDGNTPVVGNISFTLTAYSHFGSTPSQNFSVSIVNPSPVWNTTTIPSSGTIGSAYNSGNINVSCANNNNLTFSQISGTTLSTVGLTLAGHGTYCTIMGTPTGVLSGGITLRADNNGSHTDQSFALTIANSIVPGTYKITVPTGVSVATIT